MEINSSGSAILYLQLDMNSSQRKCLSAISLDTTVSLGVVLPTLEAVTKKVMLFCLALNKTDQN